MLSNRMPEVKNVIYEVTKSFTKKKKKTNLKYYRFGF